MDYATTLNIDQQGRIIIPAKVRKALQLHTGDVLMLEADTRNICLRKCDSHIPMDIRLDSFLDILHSKSRCISGTADFCYPTDHYNIRDAQRNELYLIKTV